jgi:hypothetical protein
LTKKLLFWFPGSVRLPLHAPSARRERRARSADPSRACECDPRRAHLGVARAPLAPAPKLQPAARSGAPLSKRRGRLDIASLPESAGALP